MNVNTNILHIYHYIYDLIKIHASFDNEISVVSKNDIVTNHQNHLAVPISFHLI